MQLNYTWLFTHILLLHPVLNKAVTYEKLNNYKYICCMACHCRHFLVVRHFLVKVTYEGILFHSQNREKEKNGI